MKTGSVVLAGAGCGDASLLTEEVRCCLRTCETLVYDDLIDKSLPDLAPEDCEKIYVGKRRGQHSMKQEQINGLLIQKAREGKKVLRLKGGDPYVFGRGGEEFLALHKEGIFCRCLPGITSAVAVPEAAGIPVTHRGVSRAVTVVTGTAVREDGKEGPDLDFPSLARLEGTLVILMGMHHLEGIARRLIEEGKAADTPAAVIMEGATLRQRCVRAPLKELAARAKEAGLTAPAVIVIGKTAAFELLPEKRLSPLAGVRVGAAGSRSFARHLEERLFWEGAQVQDTGILKICPIPGPLPDFSGWDWLVFTSPNGVRIFWEKMKKEKKDLRVLAGKKIAVIGPGTGKALEEAGLYPDYMPKRYDGAHLGEGLCGRICKEGGKGALFLRAAQAGPDLPKAFERFRIPFLDWPLYETVPDREALECARLQTEGETAPDYLVFGSASAVRAWFLTQKPEETKTAQGNGREKKKPVYVSMGPSCSAQLAALTKETFLTALPSSVDGIAACLRKEEEKRIRCRDFVD